MLEDIYIRKEESEKEQLKRQESQKRTRFMKYKRRTSLKEEGVVNSVKYQRSDSLRT